MAVIHKEHYTIGGKFGEKEVVSQANKVEIRHLHEGKPWDSVTIIVSEAVQTDDGVLFGTSDSVRLHKPRAIAAARAILKHFGEDCGPVGNEVW